MHKYAKSSAENVFETFIHDKISAYCELPLFQNKSKIASPQTPYYNEPP